MTTAKHRPQAGDPGWSCERQSLLDAGAKARRSEAALRRERAKRFAANTPTADDLLYTGAARTAYFKRTGLIDPFDE